MILSWLQPFLTCAIFPTFFAHDCRYLVLFGSEKYDFSYNRIRYLIGVKSGITYIISHNYVKIKIDSYDYLTLE